MPFLARLAAHSRSDIATRQNGQIPGAEIRSNADPRVCPRLCAVLRHDTARCDSQGQGPNTSVLSAPASLSYGSALFSTVPSAFPRAKEPRDLLSQRRTDVLLRLGSQSKNAA